MPVHGMSPAVQEAFLHAQRQHAPWPQTRPSQKSREFLWVPQKKCILNPSKTKTMTSLSNCCSSLPSVSIHLLQIRLCFGVQLSITVHNFFQSFGSKFCFRSFLQLQHIGHMPMISQQQVAAILRRTETAAARHGGPEEQTTPGHFVGRVALVLRR